MRIRTLIGLALAALSLAAAPPAPAQEPGVLRLPWDQWQMHLGDDPQCAQIIAPTCIGKPMVFEDWGPLNHWQRIEVALPADLQSTPQLGLLVQGDYPVYEVYVNGQMIGGSGSLATRQGPQCARAIFNIPPCLLYTSRCV